MEGSKPKLIHAETEDIDRWQREDTNAITPPARNIFETCSATSVEQSKLN
jgi:hypothetical protein